MSSLSSVACALVMSFRTRVSSMPPFLPYLHSYILGAAPSSPPHPISDTTLRDPRTQQVRQGLVADVDYIAVPPVIWFIFSLLDGTADEEGEDDKKGKKSTTMTPSRVTICRFHTNVYGAEVPQSAVREISRRAQQQSHIAVDRLMRRQYQALLRLGGGRGSSSESGVPLPAGEFQVPSRARTNSIVTESSWFSPSYPYQENKDRRDGGGDESYPLPATQGRAPPLLFGLSHPQPGNCGGDSNDGDEGQEAGESSGPWYLRHLYGCCFMLPLVSFLNFAQEKLASSSSSFQCHHHHRAVRSMQKEAKAEEKDGTTISTASFPLPSHRGA